MIQLMLVAVCTICATVWLALRFYNTFLKKHPGCGSGCGACSSLDIDAIERTIRKNEAIGTTLES